MIVNNGKEVVECLIVSRRSRRSLRAWPPPRGLP